MMSAQSQPGQTDKRQETMPAPVRRAVLAGVGLVMVAALYLIAVRGDALLVDLSALGQRIWCF